MFSSLAKTYSERKRIAPCIHIIGLSFLIGRRESWDLLYSKRPFKVMSIGKCLCGSHTINLLRDKSVRMHHRVVPVVVFGWMKHNAESCQDEPREKLKLTSLNEEELRRVSAYGRYLFTWSEVSFLDWFLVSCRLQANLFKELQFTGLSIFFSCPALSF